MAQHHTVKTRVSRPRSPGCPQSCGPTGKTRTPALQASDPDHLQAYYTDPDGVMEKLLEMKTYTMPQDPQLVRQLIELYVDRIEIHRKHGVIYYHIGTCEGDQPAMETIYLDDEGQAKCDSQQPRDPQDAVCCPSGGRTGVDPSTPPALTDGIAVSPHTRGCPHF